MTTQIGRTASWRTDRAATRLQRRVVGVGGLAAAALLVGVTLAPAANIGPVNTGPIAHAVSLRIAPASLYTPAVALDTVHGYTYVASGNGRHVAVLDTRTGAALRTLTVGVPVPAVPNAPTLLGPWLVVDPTTGHLFVLAGSLGIRSQILRLAVLDATTGHTLRVLTLAGPPGGWGVGAPPLVVDARDGRVFVSRFDLDGLDVLDARTGRVVRSVVIGLATRRPKQGVIVAAAAVDEQSRRVFVSDDANGTVTTLAATSGRVLRVVTVGPHPAMPLVDTRSGRVTVPTPDWVSVLDATTGRVLRGRVHGGEPSVGYGRAVDEPTARIVTVGVGGLPLHLRDSTTGRLLRGVPVPGDHMDVAVDGRSGNIFVLNLGPSSQRTTAAGTSTLFTGYGSVAVLDGRTGIVSHTFPVGLGYGRISIDTRLRRAVVVTSGGQLPAGSDPWGWVPSGIRRALPFVSRPSASPHSPAMATATTVTFIDTSHL